MAFYEQKVKDYSTPYKTFNDLDLDDNIYIIDFKRLCFKEYSIKEYIKKDSSDYYKENYFEIDIKIEVEPDKLKQIRIYNGNSFLSESSFMYEYGTNKLFISTDKRICESVLDVLTARMQYQWEQFSEIFNNPLSGKYEPRHIILR